MEVYVGTSGWLYDWNQWGNFDWYTKYSGLNAVELNASFYRFPFSTQVKGWTKKSMSRRLRWSVKVHRSITHYRKLSESSLQIWGKFQRLFEPLEEAGLLDFYLFQMPPSFIMREDTKKRVETFLEGSGLTPSQMALELRHKSWFNNQTVKWARKLGVTLVSIDSPMATWIIESNGIVYLRMHGRVAWYAHDYSLSELKEIRDRIKSLDPIKIYVFFNNNHWMLDNARITKELLKEIKLT